MACKHSFNISSGCFSPRDFLKSFFSSLKVFFSSEMLLSSLVLLNGICWKIQKFSCEQEAN